MTFFIFTPFGNLIAVKNNAWIMTEVLRNFFWFENFDGIKAFRNIVAVFFEKAKKLRIRRFNFLRL